MSGFSDWVQAKKKFLEAPAGFRRNISERTHPAVIMVAAIWVYIVKVIVIVKEVIEIISTAFRLRVQRVFLDEVCQSYLVPGCGLSGPAIQCLLSAVFLPAGPCHNVWLASGELWNWRNSNILRLGVVFRGVAQGIALKPGRTIGY